MWAALLLIIVPVLLFVLAFVYETYLSLKRLAVKQVSRSGYLTATWEVTHTLLVFAVVMLVMLFTSSLDRLGSAIFTSTFWAATALGVRGVCYIYLFYGPAHHKTNWIDAVFALSHVVAAVLLVVTVVKAMWFIFRERPEANSQFIPWFIPGLVLVLLVCAVPLWQLYHTKD